MTPEEREIALKDLKKYSKKLRSENSKRRDSTTMNTPEKAGYSVYVRRPIRNILDWMYTVEDILDDLINSPE